MMFEFITESWIYRRLAESNTFKGAAAEIAIGGAIAMLGGEVGLKAGLAMIALGIFQAAQRELKLRKNEGQK